MTGSKNTRSKIQKRNFPVTLSGAAAISADVPGGDDPAAGCAAARAHVNDIIRAADDIKIVFDHNDGRAVCNQRLENAEQRAHVERGAGRSSARRI